MTIRMQNTIKSIIVLLGLFVFSQTLQAAPSLQVTLQHKGNDAINLTISPDEMPHTLLPFGLTNIKLKPVDMESWVVAAWQLHTEKAGWSKMQEQSADNSSNVMANVSTNQNGLVNALSIYLADASGSWDLSYRIHQDGLWSEWCYSGEQAGNHVEGGAIVAIQIHLHDLDQETDTMLRGQYMTQGGNAAAASPISTFQDEKIALDRVNQDPSSENLIALSQVRYLHAMDLLRIAEEKGDIDAMELALQYANAATQTDPYEPAYWQLVGAIHARFTEDDSQQIAALNAYTRALELTPDKVGLLLLAAEVEQRLGLVGDASLHLYQAMKNDPEQITQTRLGLFASACTQGEIESDCHKMLTKLRPDMALAPAMQITDAILLIDTEPQKAKRILRLVSRRGTEQQIAYATMLFNEIQWREANR